jgi:DNA-binding transcriptional regulator YiaG
MDLKINMAKKNARRPLIPGLSRKEIAERLGVSWRTVERWEQTGKHPKWVDKVLLTSSSRFS